jgi:hypothetical protein
MQPFCRCKDGYVKVYIQGQEEEHKYDKPDYEFCGKNIQNRSNMQRRLQTFLFFTSVGSLTVFIYVDVPLHWKT